MSASVGELVDEHLIILEVGLFLTLFVVLLAAQVIYVGRSFSIPFIYLATNNPVVVETCKKYLSLFPRGDCSISKRVIR